MKFIKGSAKFMLTILVLYICLFIVLARMLIKRLFE